MIQVSMHGKERMHERCGIKLKSTDRLANIAFENGLTHAETTGTLNRYVTSLYMYNGQANNIRLYGDKTYIFCNDVLVTVLDTPRKYRDLVRKQIDRRNRTE